MLFMRLQFIFIGFIILTFLNKGMFQICLLDLMFLFYAKEKSFHIFWFLCRWYKIKVTMRLEVGEDSYPGIPARVVQYEGDLYS
jgi:hypothetical protein